MNLFFQMAYDRNQLALTAILYNSDLRQFYVQVYGKFIPTGGQKIMLKYGGDSDVGDFMMVTDLRCW